MNEQIALGTNLIVPIIQNLSQKGLRRLSPEIQLKSLKQTLYLMENTDAEICKDLSFGSNNVDPTAQNIQKFNLAVLQVFNNEELRKLYRIQRMAIFAEINDYPKGKELTAHETAFAEKVFDKALRKEFDKLTPNQQQKLIRVTEAPEMASDKEACLYGALILRALTNAPGVGGEWARLNMLL